jgi:toxin ParE1/3/4
MAYKIIVSPKVQREIENAIEYYELYSQTASKNFKIELQLTYDLLASNPFYQIRYKNIRALKINKFPYELFFVINED